MTTRRTALFASAALVCSFQLVVSAQTRARSAAAQPQAASAGTPVLTWHADEKNPTTVLKADPVVVNQTDAMFVEAVCGPNGASVNFKILKKNADIGPEFDHHEDPSPAGARSDIVDIDVRTDGKSRIAKGFLAVDGNDQFVNSVGVLFYDPGIAERVVGERRIQTRTGTPLDGLLGALIQADASPEIEEGIRTSAGPLPELVNARSIEMWLPVRGARSKAAVELSPATPVLHEFAERCYSRFGGPSVAPSTRAPATAAPAGTSRTAPANPSGARRTR